MGFLLSLALRWAGPQTPAMHVASLKFLYATTLRRPEEVVAWPGPRSRETPDILGGREVG